MNPPISKVLDGVGDLPSVNPLVCFVFLLRAFFAMVGEDLPSHLFALICNNSKSVSQLCFVNEPLVKMSAS